MDNIFSPQQKIFLKPKLPGDKSISHRSLIFAALANGVSSFENLSFAEDVLSTKKVLSELGVEFSGNEKTLRVFGLNKKLKKPRTALDCGNAGTLMRLMMGVLAGQDFESTLIGDESLSKRPMKRVAAPLSKLGAHISLQNENFAPVKISPAKLNGAHVNLETASAQVKSALLLAGLYANEKLTLTGKIQSRDHTERLLKYFGADLSVTDKDISLKPSNLRSVEYFVPNDISAASFWMAAGLLASESDVVLENVGLNPSRMGFVDVLKNAGANIEITLQHETPEPMGSIRVKSSQLKAFEVPRELIPLLIDEIPLLALLATQARGTSKIFGADELRHKESDRLETTRAALHALGASIQISGGDITITGKQSLSGGHVQTQNDHRIAMMAIVARFCTAGDVKLEEVVSAKISDPFFIEQMAAL